MCRDIRRQPLDGTKIGILGKGGSGKSTVTALLARVLLRLHYAPVVLDADSTNSGMSSALGLKDVTRSLLDHFGGAVFTGGMVTCPVDDPTPLPGAAVELESLPGSVLAGERGGIRLLVAGKMGRMGVGSGCDGPIAKIARDLTVRAADRAPVLIVDLKAGFEDSARGVLIGLDQVVVVVDPTVAAIGMAVDMKAALDGLRRGMGPATSHLQDPALVRLARDRFASSRVPDLTVVLNKVPDEAVETFLRRRLAAHGIVPSMTLGVDPGVARAWLEEEPLEGGWAVCQLEELVRVLEANVEAAGARATEPVTPARTESERKRGGS